MIHQTVRSKASNKPFDLIWPARSTNPEVRPWSDGVIIEVKINSVRELNYVKLEGKNKTHGHEEKNNYCINIVKTTIIVEAS